MFDGTHPYQGCTLMQLPLGVSPYQWQRGPEASTFSSGYVTGACPGVVQHRACGDTETAHVYWWSPGGQPKAAMAVSPACMASGVSGVSDAGAQGHQTGTHLFHGLLWDPLCWGS